MRKDTQDKTVLLLTVKIGTIFLLKAIFFLKNKLLQMWQKIQISYKRKYMIDWSILNVTSETAESYNATLDQLLRIKKMNEWMNGWMNELMNE